MKKLETLFKAIQEANPQEKVVTYRGNPKAKLIFIGEAPGKQEATQGLPFVGQSGKLLDQLLLIANFTPEQFYITNLVKHRPPNNRDPKKSEIQNYAHFGQQEIALLNPIIIAPLGRYATNHLLNNNSQKLDLLQGRPQTPPSDLQKLASNLLYIFPLYHPAATLYNRKKLPILQQSLIDLYSLCKTTIFLK